VIPGPFVTVVFFVALGVIAWLYFSLRKQAIQLQNQRDSLMQEKKIVFDFLHDMGEAVSTENVGQGEFLDMVLRCAVRTMGAQSGAIFLLDEQKKLLTAAVVVGAFPPPHPLPQTTASAKVASKSRFLEQAIKAEPQKVGEGIIGGVAHSAEPVLITNGANDPRVPKFDDPIWRIETMMAVPLLLRNETLGVMAIVNKSGPAPYTEGELSVFTSLADQATLALFHSKFHQLQQEKTRMDRDLQIARDIQTLLLPPAPPKVKGFDLAAINLPASHVGGDYYDFYPIDEHRLAIGIADVSGKGVPGALMMVMCRSVTRSKATSYRNASSVMKEVNRLLSGDMKADMFISMSYAILDTAKRTLSVARAGHEPALVVRAATHAVEAVFPKGMALGIDNGEHFDLAIEETTISLAANDVVAFYTDGITEAMDAQGQEFGREQFQEALRVAAGGSSQEILGNVCERIKRFIGTHPQHDDMTLVVIKAT
jgi:sigma-B regulation protein RsbU (phosphoserine phosphatase)